MKFPKNGITAARLNAVNLTDYVRSNRFIFNVEGFAMSAKKSQLPPLTIGTDSEVDILVVGSGTGMAAALSAEESGLEVLIIEKSQYVGGSTALSGGAFWVPGNSILKENGADTDQDRARTYLENVVGDSAPAARWQAYLDHGPAAIDMIRRNTPMEFMWGQDYADYHSELPGASVTGRSVECQPFDGSILGAERARLRPSAMGAPIPMPVTSADYKWMNLMAKVPHRGFGRVGKRAFQGIGGMALGREYLAGGQAIAAGLFAGVLDTFMPIWTETSLVKLLTNESGAVTGAVVEQHGKQITVTTRKGVILAAGGFDHDEKMRTEFQSPTFTGSWSLGNAANTGDAIRAGQEVGGATTLMDQAWWFPAVASPDGGEPGVMLAERSLPGSFIVDGSGNRFINESIDYMTFGQTVLKRDLDGNPVGDMWIIFDQEYRNSYLFAAVVYPRMPIPDAWYEAGIAVKADTPRELAAKAGLPVDAFAAQFARFNTLAKAGKDDDFNRGAAAYDRYYGDPTVTPNPNLRQLTKGPLYAVRVVCGDLGTCGGLKADEFGRVLTKDDTPIAGLYAIGNTAANAFGKSYPGAGATIGQGLVFGHIAAQHARTR